MNIEKYLKKQRGELSGVVELEKKQVEKSIGAHLIAIGANGAERV